MFPKQEPAPKMSRTKALNEFCKRCIYDPADAGSWRAQVEACASVQCPLHQHRPVTVATVHMHRKVPVGTTIDMDAILADLDDEEETVEA